jgi:hypothetical protein
MGLILPSSAQAKGGRIQGYIILTYLECLRIHNDFQESAVLNIHQPCIGHGQLLQVLYVERIAVQPGIEFPGAAALLVVGAEIALL